MVAKALNSSSVILGETNQRPIRIGGLTVGSCEFGDLALHGDDSLSFLYPEIECIGPPPSCFPVKADTWSAYGLIADLEVLVTGPDDLTDEPLAHLDYIPEARVRPEAFRFGELAHAFHVGAEEIGDLCAYFEILPRKASIFIPGLPVTGELQ